MKRIGDGDRIDDRQLAKYAFVVWMNEPPEALGPPPLPERWRLYLDDGRNWSARQRKELFEDDEVNGFVECCMKRLRENEGNLYWLRQWKASYPHKEWDRMEFEFVRAIRKLEAVLGRGLNETSAVKKGGR